MCLSTVTGRQWRKIPLEFQKRQLIFAFDGLAVCVLEEEMSCFMRVIPPFWPRAISSFQKKMIWIVSWPPGRGEEIIYGLFQRSCPCWLFWIYGAFGAARNGTSDDGLEFAKAEVWSFYSLPRHRLTAGWAKERFNLTHIFRRRTPDQLTFPRFPIQIA